MSIRMYGGRNYSKGLIAEDIAILYFEKLGFALLERRWRSSVGEIDLILSSVAEGGLLFVEVKSRCMHNVSANFVAPLISAPQARRLWHSVEEFVALRNGHSGDGEPLRFDVVIIESPDMQVVHFPNVFLQDFL